MLLSALGKVKATGCKNPHNGHFAVSKALEALEPTRLR
jgi:TATA-box binding protein (TBP) (component of TFIID and TFIIIB)